MKQIALYLAGVLVLMFSACSQDHQVKQEVRSPIPVKVGKPLLKEQPETVSVSGTVVSPDAPSNLSFLVSGKVIQVGPREGDYVRKGQVLASIDPIDYRLALTAAKAQSDLAQVAYRRAEDEHRRMKMLFDSKSLAPNDYQKYKSAYESAEQQYLQAEASEKRFEKHLDDATLRSPVDGFISRRSVEPGQLVSPEHSAFEIIKLDPIEVNVGVPETDVHLVHTGQKATITLPALPGESFEGTVRLINVSADSATRTFMTRISVPNPKHKLRIGMVAEVRISGDKVVKRLSVPIEAVVRDPQGVTTVLVYYPDQNRAHLRRVEVGSVFGRDIEIRKGLIGDESVILAGQERLREGDVVSVASSRDQEERTEIAKKETSK